MILNYFKIAYRSLWKNKAYTSINLFGLAIAFAASIMLFLTCYYEFTFDSNHANLNSIYRVYFKKSKPDAVSFSGVVSVPVRGALLAENKKEIQYASRILNGSCQLLYNNKTLVGKIGYVDADFLKMFSINIINGNKTNSLSELNSVVLNETNATNIFGKENPIGKIIELNLDGVKKPFMVSAISKDQPRNTSIKNEMLIRFENHIDYQAFSDRWNASNHSLYVMLKPETNWQSFEISLKNFTQKYFKDIREQLVNDGAKADERGEVYSTRLLPMAEQHFDKRVSGSQSVNIIFPYTLLLISILILVIACINFVNLSIARSLSRAKEVGMRKALGAFKGQIIGQFWGEALVICIAALLLGIALTYIFLPNYNTLLRSNVEFSSLFRPAIFSILFLSFLIITILAGGYPAWFVAKLNTIEVLKGKLKIGGSSVNIRNGLIIMQFTFSIFLIACTLLIWRQLNYLQNKPLGFAQENVVSIPVGTEVAGKKMLNIMRNKLANNSNILSISAADNNLGRGKDDSGFKSVFSFVQDGKSYSTNGLFVDFDYLQTLGLKLKEGRFFSRKYMTDSTEACIINESMASQIGGKNLIGKRLAIGDNANKTIVGIIKDYHFESLKNKVDAMTFMVKGFDYQYIFVKIDPNNSEATLNLLEKTYREIAPNSTYLGSFLDENRANQYKKERLFSQTFLAAAILAILLTCMGLVAMSVLMIAQRTKEIGIRKVLGASIGQVIGLISKDFLILVLIAIIIASPLAYYTMNGWLQDFAFRVNISWWVFVMAGLIAIIITITTISLQAIKAAMANPVKSLKTE